VGFFTGAAQYASYAVAQQYFTPLVIASSYLVEPIIAQTLGCIFAIDQIPGILTWVGATITLGGIFIITKGGFELENEKQGGQLIEM
jgi:drug/metabolite transporter (DMT)-like permease